MLRFALFVALAAAAVGGWYASLDEHFHKMHWSVAVADPVLRLVSGRVLGMRRGATFRRDRFERLDSWTAVAATGGEYVDGVATTDVQHGRVFESEDAAPGRVVVFAHGGGFTILHARSDGYDRVCRDLALQTRAIIVSVEYRLAPEHPFPAAHDDTAAALRWVRETLSSGSPPRWARTAGPGARVVLSGDSAGGNLAATVATQSTPGSLAALALVYPKVEFRTARGADGETRVALERPDGPEPIIPHELREFFHHSYVRSAADAERPEASVLRASEAQLAALPPTLVLGAEFDPLLREGNRLAARLEELGVEVERHTVRDAPHGCFSMPWLPQFQESVGVVARFINRAFE